MSYKHIVWDWNGTLLNDAEACKNAVNKLLEKRDMDLLSIHEYRARIQFPVKNLYYESGFDLENESYETISEEYINNYIENFSLIQLQVDAKSVLQKFQQQGLKQHIVSASGNEILIHQVEKYGLKTFFTHILGQKNNQAESKVHLAKQLIDLTGCDPKEVLFIGDTVHDYEVAKEAGFNCNLVANGHCNRDRLEAVGVPVFQNLTALFEAF